MKKSNEEDLGEWEFGLWIKDLHIMFRSEEFPHFEWSTFGDERKFLVIHLYLFQIQISYPRYIQ